VTQPPASENANALTRHDHQPIYSANHTADSTPECDSTHDFRDLREKARKIHERRGFVQIQLFTLGYLTMTASWICNVRLVDASILGSLLFIATDEEAYRALLRVDAGDATIHYEPYSSKAKLTYGEHVYYEFILWRTHILKLLLQDGMNVWMTESDAVWFRNPTDTVLATEGDMVTMSDHRNPSQHLVQGGFLLLRPTPLTLQMWLTMCARLTGVLQQRPGANIGHKGNEQVMMSQITRKLRLRIGWLPREHFVNGGATRYWSGGDTESVRAQAYVLLNNYVHGIAPKISRAKHMKHWYLMTGDKMECDPAAVL